MASDDGEIDSLLSIAERSTRCGFDLDFSRNTNGPENVKAEPGSRGSWWQRGDAAWLKLALHHDAAAGLAGCDGAVAAQPETLDSQMIFQKHRTRRQLQ